MSLSCTTIKPLFYGHYKLSTHSKLNFGSIISLDDMKCIISLYFRVELLWSLLYILVHVFGANIALSVMDVHCW